MVKKDIEEKIQQFETGYVFSVTDLLPLGTYDNIRQVLSRLAQEGVIRRVLDGFYDRPYYSQITKEFTAVNLNQLAKAIARHFNWTIAPSGALALNMLGLSTQVPHEWHFISDGPYRQYQVANRMLKFSHRNNRSLTALSEKSILTIEALKYLGREHVTKDLLEQLTQVLTVEDIDVLKEDSKKTSKWIYQVVNQLEKSDEIKRVSP